MFTLSIILHHAWTRHPVRSASLRFTRIGNLCELSSIRANSASDHCACHTTPGPCQCISTILSSLRCHTPHCPALLYRCRCGCSLGTTSDILRLSLRGTTRPPSSVLINPVYHPREARNDEQLSWPCGNTSCVSKQPTKAGIPLQSMIGLFRYRLSTFTMHSLETTGPSPQSRGLADTGRDIGKTEDISVALKQFLHRSQISELNRHMARSSPLEYPPNSISRRDREA